MTQHDELHYVRIPDGFGGRAEMVRLCYVLAGRPYRDVLHTFAEAPAAVTGKNPFLQFPFVVTPSGEVVYQTLAIMHHAAHGTPAWPSDPAALTRALAAAFGGYDLYQAFAGFTPTDAAAKAKFEEKTAPKLFGALDTMYADKPFAAGDAPSFADCYTHESVAWCVRRNEACKRLLETKPALSDFMKRFAAVPAIATFMAKQAAARATDNAL